jgi:hypothetical protein
MADPRDDLLIAELRGLGARLEVPPPPDVRAAVRSRLLARPRRRWRAIAAAVAVALLIAVVPPARAAVAHAVTGLLNFAGVRVRHGTPAPAASPSPLPSLRSAGLDNARRMAHFPVRVPVKLGVPEQVQLADPAPDGAPRVVTLIYGGGAIRLDEFDGQLDQLFLKTQAGPDASWVEVRGSPGLWFKAPHAVAYIDRQGVTHEETSRLAGPTLIWTDGTVTYRLEGFATLDTALAVALSIG